MEYGPFVVAFALGVLTAIGGVAGILYLNDWYHTRNPRRLRWAHAERAIRELKRKMREERFQPDIVIGLRRSGGVAGGMLAGILGIVPFAIADWDYEWVGAQRRVTNLSIGIGALDLEGKNVLLLDARPRTGATLAIVREELDRITAGHSPKAIRIAAVFSQGVGPVTVDYVGMRVRDLELLANPPWKLDPDYIDDWQRPATAGAVSRSQG